MSAAPEAPAAAPTFEALVAAHHGDVFRFLARLCAGDRQLAEDLCQEAFLRAYKALGGLGADANHRAWLYRIAYNLCVDDRRRSWRRVALEDEHPARGVDHDGRELVRAVSAFIRALPPKQRAALVLRRVEGREYAEVADIMGCSEDSARANVFQALKKLRDRFGEEYEAL